MGLWEDVDRVNNIYNCIFTSPRGVGSKQGWCRLYEQFTPCMSNCILDSHIKDNDFFFLISSHIILSYIPTSVTILRSILPLPAPPPEVSMWVGKELGRGRRKGQEGSLFYLFNSRKVSTLS